MSAQADDDCIEVHGERCPNDSRAPQNNPGVDFGMPEMDPSLNFSSEGDRKISYKGRWDARRKPSADDMARAGFYRVGEGDTVKCFSCELQLKDWKREDNPLNEHKHWLDDNEKTCDYVNSL